MRLSLSALLMSVLVSGVASAEVCFEPKVIPEFSTNGLVPEKICISVYQWQAGDVILDARTESARLVAVDEVSYAPNTPRAALISTKTYLGGEAGPACGVETSLSLVLENPISPDDGVIEFLVPEIKVKVLVMHTSDVCHLEPQEYVVEYLRKN
jgi:hypothetical protein